MSSATHSLIFYAQERDSTELQAQAQLQAALAERTAAALAAGSNPHAVEGYVPRSSPDVAPSRTADPSSAPVSVTEKTDSTSHSRSAACKMEQAQRDKPHPAASDTPTRAVEPSAVVEADEEKPVAAKPSIAAGEASRSQSRAPSEPEHDRSAHASQGSSHTHAAASSSDRGTERDRSTSPGPAECPVQQPVLVRLSGLPSPCAYHVSAAM